MDKIVFVMKCMYIFFYFGYILKDIVVIGLIIENIVLFWFC